MAHRCDYGTSCSCCDRCKRRCFSKLHRFNLCIRVKVIEENRSDAETQEYISSENLDRMRKVVLQVCLQIFEQTV